MAKIVFVSLFMMFLLGPTQILRADMFESFEDKIFWQIAPWGDEAKLATSEEQASHGKRSLEIHFAPGMSNRNKGVVLERDLTNYSQQFSKLVFDVYNKGPAKLSVALAVETDEYFESQALPLEKNWNRNLAFFLNGKNFKSKSSNWQYETPVNLKSPLKKMYLMFYRNQAPEGTFFIDRIEVSDEQPPQIAGSTEGGQGKLEVERSKTHHYRPKGLPLEIFTR